MTANCPLCGYTKPVLGEIIPVRLLVVKFLRFLGEGIEDHFSGVEQLGFFHCGDCDLRFFFPPIAGSEAFYEKLQQFDWYYLRDKPEYNYARQFVHDKDDVLEIGAGEGFFLERIRPKSYLGLEFSSRAITKASEKGIALLQQTIQEHAARNPMAYDVVCSFQVLEHVPDPLSFLLAATDCLRPGGRLVLSVPSADSYLSFVEDGILNMPPHHLTWWSDKTLVRVGELIKMENIYLKRDRLSDVHLSEYSRAICLRMLKRFFGRQPALLCRSLGDRVLLKVSSYLAPLLARGMKEQELRPDGHSTTAVFKKSVL